MLILIIFKKYNAIYVSLIDAQYYDLLFQHGAHAMLHNILRLTYFSLEHSHQLVEKIPSILHKKPTFSILHHYFYKTPTSIYLFYKTIQ